MTWLCSLDTSQMALDFWCCFRSRASPHAGHLSLKWPWPLLQRPKCDATEWQWIWVMVSHHALPRMVGEGCMMGRMQTVRLQRCSRYCRRPCNYQVQKKSKSLSFLQSSNRWKWNQLQFLQVFVCHVTSCSCFKSSWVELANCRSCLWLVCVWNATKRRLSPRSGPGQSDSLPLAHKRLLSSRNILCARLEWS